MSASAAGVSDNVKEFIVDIISKHQLNATSEVIYNRGSTAGDGYVSRTHAVSINLENDSSLELFVKEGLHIKSDPDIVNFGEYYANEIYFYNEIHPTYLKFLKKKGIVGRFIHVPTCYGTSSKNLIAFENVKERGFRLFDSKKVMNDKHIELVLKAIAKLHAVSFAFKDQNKTEHESLMEKVANVMKFQASEHFDAIRNGWIDQFIRSLDPIEDKHVLAKLENLSDRLNSFFKESIMLKNEYDILIHGDIWCNNIMFAYENRSQEDPVDVVLIDWQMIRCAMPIQELAFFFYTVAGKDALDKLHYFLKVYHEELSINIKVLGSDSNAIYSYSTLEEQWKEHGKYGFVMALLTLFLMTVERDENLCNFEKEDLEHPDSWEIVTAKRMQRKMSGTSADISDDVKEFIVDIISKHQLNATSEVIYNPGSTAGDGYLSKAHAVSINIKNDNPLELFVKEGLHIKSDPNITKLGEHYANEIYFYDEIYPTYLKFLKKKGVKNRFIHVPKCYGTSSKNLIAFENLKKKGFQLFDSKKVMSDKHIELVLKAIAKLHAVSFAFKDQNKTEHESLMEKVTNVMKFQASEDFDAIRNVWVDQFIRSLDPIEDKDILAKLGNLGDRLNSFFKQSIMLKNEYDILIHGDIWCNNIMFAYENRSQEDPIDVVLIDWQMIRCAMPIQELAFFFYTVAGKDALDKLHYFLKVYHEELSINIKVLGSDPNAIYSYSALEEQWKEHGKYGFVMAFLTLFLMTVERNENLFNFEEADVEHPESWEIVTAKKSKEYFKRLKILAEHLILNDFL